MPSSIGIAASKGRLSITVRGEIDRELEALLQKLENLAKIEGEADGLEVKFSYKDRFPVTRNHKTSVNKIRSVGQKRNFQIIELKEGMRGSEDFGYYLEKTPGALFFIGNGEDHPEIHTANYDFPDEIIETAVEMFKGLVGMVIL